MRKTAITTVAAIVFTMTVVAQKQIKPWNQWSDKEAQNILNDSPWGQTYTDTDTSEMFFDPTTSQGGRGDTSSRRSQGATNQAVSVNFRIRFFTARPIRQAFVRMVELQQPNLPKDALERLDAFANLGSDRWIIVAVAFDSTDQRYMNPVMQALGAATIDVVKNDTYLERADGKRIFATEYVPPGKDGFGARFIFPRLVDDKPFLGDDSKSVRFYTQFRVGSTAIKIDRRFKVSDMVYDGKLEY